MLLRGSDSLHGRQFPPIFSPIGSGQNRGRPGKYEEKDIQSEEEDVY